MGVEAELREEFERWERKETAVLKVLPYPLLAVSVVLTLLQPLWNAEVHLPWVFGLSALLASAVSAVSYVGGAAGITAGVWWKWPAVSALTTVMAMVAFYADVMSDRRNHRQKRALVELHKANVELETALAENAGLQARLLVRAREAGVLEERQRMAREIHDTLAQGLAGIPATNSGSRSSPGSNAPTATADAKLASAG